LDKTIKDHNYSTDISDLIYVRHLVIDDIDLEPNEKSENTFIGYIPYKKYEYLEVFGDVVCSDRDSKIRGIENLNDGYVDFYQTDDEGKIIDNNPVTNFKSEDDYDLINNKIRVFTKSFTSEFFLGE